MMFEFTQVTQVDYFKSFSRVKSSQDEKVCFIQGNELKLVQVELLLFFRFKSIWTGFLVSAFKYIQTVLNKINIHFFHDKNMQPTECGMNTIHKLSTGHKKEFECMND